MARTVWRPVISGLPSAAPKGARKELALSPAKGGVARRRTCVPPLVVDRSGIASRSILPLPPPKV
ncbi:MAG: hypothetical protein ABSF90_17530 [Syntrophobacteraceae bacterium]